MRVFPTFEPNHPQVRSNSPQNRCVKVKGNVSCVYSPPSLDVLCTLYPLKYDLRIFAYVVSYVWFNFMEAYIPFYGELMYFGGKKRKNNITTERMFYFWEHSHKVVEGTCIFISKLHQQCMINAEFHFFLAIHGLIHTALSFLSRLLLHFWSNS